MMKFTSMQQGTTRKFSSILLALFLPLALWGQIDTRDGQAIGAGGVDTVDGVATSTLSKIDGQTVAAGGPSYLIDENCEGTGTGGDFTDTAGTIDWDSTSGGPSPLSGSESLYISNQGGNVYTVGDFTGGANRYAKFIFGGSGVSFIDNKPFVEFLDSSDNVLATAQVDDAEIEIFHGSDSFFSTDSPLSNDTAIYIWFEYEAGSGSNGVLRLYHNTTDSKPGAANYSLSSGTSTADAAKIRLGFGTFSGGMYWDDIKVSESAIN